MLNLRKILFASTLAFATVLFSFNTMEAQTKKGNFMIGGELGLSTASSTVSVNGSETEGSSATQFNIAPSVGYFFVNNFATGIGIDYTLSTVKNNNRDELDSDLLFGPFLRYYIPFGDKALFFETDFGYGNSTDNITINNEQQLAVTNVFAFSIGPGFTIFSNDNIGIEALAKYNFASSNSILTANGVETTSYSLTHAFDFSIGLQVYLGRK
ncbi:MULTISPECIES: outer membrane beta-barrel protein [unclassified Aureispira]|uniref:outer membrane beta-barrel protein n=1 Tax=unclassified Aureispira TaxID=2649989 RepID=UPI0007C826DA|nr:MULTISPECIES: outer membrane beta-barrel protein [unclassified Aureispira]WMX14849.1 outer membrane beta-barrel protein [Aureispira sp. CCB-E]